MTKPSTIRPREGEQPGTPFEHFRAGAPLSPMQFTLDAETVDEYATLIGADRDWYRLPPGESGPLAPATAPALFLLALLYRTFPPVQGLVLTHQAFDFESPWSPGMSITGRGAIVNPEERRGRQYISWEASFVDDATGRLLTRARNTCLLPASDRQATDSSMCGPKSAPAEGIAPTQIRSVAHGDPFKPGTRIDCAAPLAMSQELFDWYGRLNGDLDVVHYDAAYAAALGYRAPIAHGMMVAAYLSELLQQVWGMRWLAGGSTTFRWIAPVYPDDLILPIVETIALDEREVVRTLRASIRCENAAGRPVLAGEAQIRV